jgi:hypothetical protein
MSDLLEPNLRMVSMGMKRAVLVVGGRNNVTSVRGSHFSRCTAAVLAVSSLVVSANAGM